jgi:hypothetical protein
MKTENITVLRAVDGALYERAELLRHGPVIIITHRLWLPRTSCMPGEEVFSVGLGLRGRELHFPFSLQLRLMIDYLARQRYGQSAGQLVAGMNADPFCRHHAANAVGKVDLHHTLSRAAAKQQAMRIRQVMETVFAGAGITLSPDRILVSEPTDTNETHYRLAAVPVWRHIE